MSSAPAEQSQEGYLEESGLREQQMVQEGFNHEKKWGMSKIKYWDKSKKMDCKDPWQGSKRSQEVLQVYGGDPEGEAWVLILRPLWKRATVKKST